MDTIVVFVHGWSVTHTDTYGELPARLAKDARAVGLSIKTKEIHLGRYISFHDEVRMQDIARAFEAAVQEQLAPLLGSNRRFVCLTHSTGGPVVREWWRRYYQKPGAETCPMSHLIMLAPANYGSALALLGKGKISRMKSWFGGVEPGQGVLDWLALGSEEAWDLNKDWMKSKAKHIGPSGVFPFVLTGQQIDRKLYDNLNSYTGELGTDGVVRAASANLCGSYVRLEQESPVALLGPRSGKETGEHKADLIVKKKLSGAPVPFRIVPKRSHSGKEMGIMRSVQKSKSGKAKNQTTVAAILACMKVTSSQEYRSLGEQFEAATAEVQEKEILEVVDGIFFSSTDFIHDHYSMVIFRITDQEGYPVTDFDLVLTAGAKSNPNHLPGGFIVDRQRNPNNLNTVTFYFNHSAMVASPEVVDPNDDNRLVRAERKEKDAIQSLGIQIQPRPLGGFARYLGGEVLASRELFEAVVKPNATTMVDIVLRRIVGKETCRLDPGIKAKKFKGVKRGEPLGD